MFISDKRKNEYKLSELSVIINQNEMKTYLLTSALAVITSTTELREPDQHSAELLFA